MGNSHLILSANAENILVTLDEMRSSDDWHSDRLSDQAPDHTVSSSLFDHIVGKRSSAIVLWWFPRQGHAILENSDEPDWPNAGSGLINHSNVAGGNSFSVLVLGNKSVFTGVFTEAAVDNKFGFVFTVVDRTFWYLEHINVVFENLDLRVWDSGHLS